MPWLAIIFMDSVKVGAIQRRLAWPLRKDDTHRPRSENKVMQDFVSRFPPRPAIEAQQTSKII